MTAPTSCSETDTPSGPTVRLPKALHERMFERVRTIRTRCETSVRRYATGINRLDRMIGKGLRPGSLTYIAGPPNVGKTALLQQMIFQLLNRYPNVIVLAFSLDDSPETFLMRFHAQFSALPMDTIGSPSVCMSKEEWQERETAWMRIEKNAIERLLVVGADERDEKKRPAATIDGIEDYIRDVYANAEGVNENQPLQLVVIIDSPRNIFSHEGIRMQSDANGRTEYIGKQLKRLVQLRHGDASIEPIIIATEHLRKETTVRPTPSSIKDSIGPTYDADLILMLWNDNQAKARQSKLVLPCPPDVNGEQLYSDPIIEVWIRKNKMGPMDYSNRNNLILMRLFQAQTRMEELPDDMFQEFASIVRNSAYGQSSPKRRTAKSQQQAAPDALPAATETGIVECIDAAPLEAMAAKAVLSAKSQQQAAPDALPAATEMGIVECVDAADFADLEAMAAQAVVSAKSQRQAAPNALPAATEMRIVECVDAADLEAIDGYPQ